jgi:hypothetical protein
MTVLGKFMTPAAVGEANEILRGYIEAAAE